MDKKIDVAEDGAVIGSSLFSAKVVEDSVNHRQDRLTTVQLVFPRILLAELNTHRVFSRSSMSSRAIPVARIMGDVLSTPYVPLYWGMNQPGMQASVEAAPAVAATATAIWLEAASSAVNHARRLVSLNIHKQNVNRLLEPFQWMRTIVSSTEWDNFFALRDHPKAEPHFQLLAAMIKTAMTISTPVDRGWHDHEDSNGWHLPYISEYERNELEPQNLLVMSAARCARVSYLNHDSTKPTFADDQRLYNLLTSDVPPHASPLEHQAFRNFFMDWKKDCGNFSGWRQHRHNLNWSREGV